MCRLLSLNATYIGLNNTNFIHTPVNAKNLPDLSRRFFFFKQGLFSRIQGIDDHADPVIYFLPQKDLLSSSDGIPA